MRVNIKSIKTIKPPNCTLCVDGCVVDKAVNWIRQENLDGSPHNLMPVALSMIAYNSGLEGQIRTTRDGAGESEVTYQLESTEPCESRIIVHTRHYYGAERE